MEIHIKRAKHGINVHRIVYPDDAVSSALCDRDQLRIHRHADFGDLLPHLAANGVLIQRGVLVVAGDALKLLLELISLDVWRHHLPKQVNDRSYHKDTEKRFESSHV